MPSNLAAMLSPQTVSELESLTWFPLAIANAFMTSLDGVFYVSAVLCGFAAVASLLRGKKVVGNEKVSAANGKFKDVALEAGIG
jgi:predicted hydrolase (HD superfamily)